MRPSRSGSLASGARPKILSTAAALALLAAGLPLFSGNALAAVGDITEYSIPSGNGGFDIVAGPDGNLWFTEYVASKVAKVTTSGVVTEYVTPNPANMIVAGPDGNLWFTEGNVNKVAKMTTSGVITEYTVPTSNAHPFGIAVGPDGNLWFTESNGNKVANVTPSGVFTEYTVPSANSLPLLIEAGPDGNIWFTEFSANKVTKVTTTGAFTEYPIPTAKSQPFGIAAGPDGDLWFTESNGNKVANVTTSGTFSEYSEPNADSQPADIVAGPDGNLWFTENRGHKLGRVTTLGTVTEYAVPSSNTTANGIAAGPDGNLWFTEDSGKVAKAASAQAPPIDGRTNPNDPRCKQAPPPENLFFIGARSPASGNPGPGDRIGSWLSDESGMHQGSADPQSPYFVFFHLTGPGVDKQLQADVTSESFDQTALFDTLHRECRIQVNIKTQIPATIDGGAYPPGAYTVAMTAWDNDQTHPGGDRSTQTWNFNVGAATTTSLASSANPSRLSQAVTFTATVMPTSATGTVTFKDGSTTLGTGTLSSGTATTTTAGLTRGKHFITAAYGGDVSFTPSTSAVLNQRVKKAATTTTLVSSRNPSRFGHAVTFTATVSPSSARGMVTFMDGTTSLGTFALSSGKAIFTTASLVRGAHTITALYGGDPLLASSKSAALRQVVN